MHLSLSFSVIVQVIQGLECLVNLEKLFLGKNKITKIEVLNNMHTCYMYMYACKTYLVCNEWQLHVVLFSSH